MSTPDETAEAQPLPVLEAPADGVPPLVDTVPALTSAIDQLAAGTGPLALDTERAHGFRYSPRAYLLQFRRAGAGTVLIDPIPFAAPAERALLSSLTQRLADTPWILHAASQDLPCLTELDLVPTTLFDTELAARLLGRPRVALVTMIEEFFGLTLRKEHSASDWSKRPLPDGWLTYAALDVELLVELQGLLADELVTAQKDEWARQEFAHLVTQSTVATTPRVDPWRRTSGLHTVRTPRGLAIVRELWQERDRLASSTDRAPGRILPDRAITQLAVLGDGGEPRRILGRADLDSISEFRWRNAARYHNNWLAALDRASSLTRDQLPPRHLAVEGPPPPRTWAARHPEAAERWERIRPGFTELAESLAVPPENLLTPDRLRRLAWEPPADRSVEGVDAFLAGLGARPWQRELTAVVVAPLL